MGFREYDGVYFCVKLKKLVVVRYLDNFGTFWLDNYNAPYNGMHVNCLSFINYINSSYYIKATEAIMVLYG